MSDPVLLRGGGRWLLFDPSTRIIHPLGNDPAPPGNPDPRIERALRERLDAIGSIRTLAVTEASMIPIAERAGCTARPTTLLELRTAREALPSEAVPDARERWLARARAALAAALSSPEETLIALAREEERLERVRGRESGAADQWVTGPRGPLQEYGVEWKGFRDLLDQHHGRLEARLEASATAVAPNLSLLLGPKIAARLIAASGGLSALSRMTSARLQLLGSRRRPGGGRGPKYGTIARAVLAADVPATRRGAYARSLAGLATIAGRADATTHRPIAEELVRRRDRRAAELRRAGAG